MTTINITRPDGTRSAYTNIGPAAWAAVQAVKPHRTKWARSEKRSFPKQAMSTADYVRQYFALNTGRRGKITAYADHLNHLALFQPLNEKPWHWAPDTVEIEMLEG